MALTTTDCAPSDANIGWESTYLSLSSLRANPHLSLFFWVRGRREKSKVYDYNKALLQQPQADEREEGEGGSFPPSLLHNVHTGVPNMVKGEKTINSFFQRFKVFF